MKPNHVRAAGLLFLVGGCSSLIICSLLTIMSFMIYVPAWMFGFPTAVLSIVTGLKLLGSRAQGSGFPTTAGTLMFLQCLNVDFIAMVCAWVAMVKLSQPESRAYLRPPTNYPPPTDPHKGRVQLDVSYHPALLLFILANPEIRIDGQPLRRGWGNHSIELDAGRHLVEVSFDYTLFERLGKSALQIDVRGGQVNDLFYRYNWPWIFCDGTLEELGERPQLTTGSPTANDGMRPYTV